MSEPTPALTTREVANKIGTDPKALRSFLRTSSDYEAMGSGSRYAFTAEDIAPMKAKFTAWLAQREGAKKARPPDHTGRQPCTPSSGVGLFGASRSSLASSTTSSMTSATFFASIASCSAPFSASCKP